MENPMETSPDTDHKITNLQSQNLSLQAEIKTLHASNQNLQSKLKEKDELIQQLQLQKDDVFKQYVDLSETIKEVSSERDTLRLAVQTLEDDFRQREMDLANETERIRKELEVSTKTVDELLDEKREQSLVCWRNLEMVQSAKHGLLRLVENLRAVRMENAEFRCEEDSEKSLLLNEELKVVLELVNLVEERFREYEEMRRKEKRELENSVVSLAEENQDMNSLLRIALVEKEAAEKSLNRLRGNPEQKRAFVLQIAEKGLQKVGFGLGFMMGSGTSETSSDNMDSDSSVKSDDSECQTEAVSLACTIETITKKLRAEIMQLQRSLEESRSHTEYLQNLSDKKSQKLAANMIYIKDSEDRVKRLAEKVEELMVENREAEEEISRWREACEMEVEAGKKVIKEHEELVNILKQELEKTRAGLRVSNSKLQLKDELVEAAIAAREAAEKSLQLADSRGTELCRQIEELTKQLEEVDKRERIHRRRFRHICWPWRALKLSTANNTTGILNVTRMLPEMQALLL